MFLKLFVTECIIRLKKSTSIREYSCHEGVYLVCNKVDIVCTCENIHKNAWTQDLLVGCLLTIVHQQKRANFLATWSSSDAQLPIVGTGDVGSLLVKEMAP